jgi:tetratricopeptide (TPR) repeat protein
LVVIQPWEFGILPKDWVKAAVNVNEFWVPSNYVRDVYIQSGVPAKKVVVVPNGVNAAQFRPEVQAMKLPTTKTFRFLFVGGTIPRKGPDLLLKAYLESFTAADDVCLVIKDFGGQSAYRGQTFEKEIEAARVKPNAPEIVYLNSEMQSGEMPGLYAACHCLVHPYRGEGFGLPVLEAMACGLPVVVTRGGATDDFVSEESGWFISATRKSIGAKIGQIQLVANGWWLEPDITDLAAKMKYIVANRSEAKARGKRGSEIARKDYAWQRVGEMVVGRLQKLAATLKTDAAPKRAQKIELPPTALLGHIGRAREALNRKQCRQAWEFALEALAARPFNPEAWLIMGEIALAAGDAESARQCAQRSRDMALAWATPKQFLKGKLRGSAHPEWLKVPAVVEPPRITVSLIVKNEERFLAQCLRSVKSIASQIIVVDTGSTDRTVEIAKEYGAEVHSFEWRDDFAGARNAALEHATGDWILSLDADEELMPGQDEILRQELQSANVMSYRIPILDAGREQEGANYVPRLFRNAPGLFFVGRIHEQASSSIQVRCQQWGLKSQIGQSRLLHHGYTDEVLAGRNKVERNLRLLNRAVEELPDEPNLVMSLGLELVRSGQLEAGIDRYWQAFHLLAALPANEVAPELRETLLTQLTSHLMTAKRFSEILLLWEVPFATAGGMTATQHFSLGLAYIELKQPTEAAEQMRQCLARRGQPALTPINPEILKAAPNHCLALCLAALNDHEGARNAFEAALADELLARGARFDFARFHASQGAHIDALKMLNQLILENPAEARVWQFGGQIALGRPECLDFARHWTGHAVKHFPQDHAILLQRAETLMLSQDIAQALPLWRQAHSSMSPRHRAAIVLCELLAGDRQHQFRPEEEPAISREAVHWYRQWITVGAHSLIHRLHERIEQVRLALPGFVTIWEAADRQARKAAA